MAMLDRNTLKEYFRSGNIPSEANFENLIDSGVNKIDDGFSKTRDEGLMISRIGGSDNLLSFYEKIGDDENPQWVIKLNKAGKENEGKNDLRFFKDEEDETPVMSFSKKGHVGINKAKPEGELDVNGWVYSKGRAGLFAKNNTINADGKWYPITEELDYCQAFEVVARTGVKNSGKHGILHAIAISAFGRSQSRITRTRCFFDFWKPVKIQIRWTGDTRAYKLEMRCKQNLGNGVKIKYYITQLWSDEEMGDGMNFY